MNEIEQHETDHECNVCGLPVVNEYGRKRCRGVTHSICPTRFNDNDLSWDSTREEIEAWREQQEPSLEEKMIEADEQYRRGDIDIVDRKIIHGQPERREIEDRNLFLESLAREFEALAELDSRADRETRATARSHAANVIRSHKSGRHVGRAES